MKKENLQIYFGAEVFFSKLAKHVEENGKKEYKNVQIFVSTIT